MAQYLSNFLNTAFSTYTEDDAFNNSVVYPITLTHTTTGTPAAGIGTGLRFITETSSGNNEIGGLIDVVTTDVTSTSEDFDFVFKTMAAGATAAEKLRIKSTGDLEVAGSLTITGGKITLAASSSRDKYRLWNTSTYAIGLENSVTYGGIETEKAMTFQMDNNNSQGFWWGDSTHTTAQGAMALTTDGKLTVAHSMRIGYGESDITIPGSAFKLDVNGNISATNIDFGEVTIGSTTGIDSWKYNSNSFNMASQDTGVTDVFVDNVNGFYLLATGTLPNVYKYTFTTAYKVDTLTYNELLDVSAEEIDVTSLFVRSDGLRIYIIGTSSNSVHQYQLSTAWNLSTATYVNSKSISTQDTSPQGLFFKSDGTKMYVLGQQNTKIYEYNLGTAWNISTATYLQQLDISASVPKPTSMKMSSDGTVLYVLSSVHDALSRFDLSTPWNITTATYTDEVDVSSITPTVNVTGPTGFDISTTANKLYVSCIDNNKIFEYDTTSESARVTGNRLIVDEDLHVKNNLIVYNNARVHDALEVARNLAVNGDSITTVSTTFNLLNNNVDSLNIASEASFIDLGSGTSLVTIANDASVQGDLTVLGTLTGTLTGSASSWTTARTITLGGDLSGSVSIDGTANVTLTATIAADSVALGTDTTGNYVASVGAGTSSTQTGSSGLTITGTGEGASVTIAHADTSTISNLTATSRTYVTGLTFDTYGHVTALTTGSETVTDTNTTYSISTEVGPDAYSEIIRLTAGGSGSGTDDITLAVGAVGGVYGLTIAESGDTITFAHADTSSVTNVTSATNTFITGQTYDTYGHVATTTTGTVSFNVAGNYSFTSITDGTNTAVADSNADTFKIRSGQQITVTVASDDVTHGDSVLIGHSNSGVTANSYGSSTSIPTITVDAQGHITAVTTNAISTSWTISDGTNTQTIDGGNTLTVNGTTNEIEVAVSATDTLTIGLPNNVTIGNNLIVTGNLTVNGTTSTVNSTTVTVDDPIITLGGDTAPASDDNKDRGVEFRWHNGTAAKVGFFGYDDSTGYFTFIPDATNTSEVFSGTKGTLDVTSITGTAASWTTARTITLGGDLSGSVSIDGSANVTLTATIAADSVALGTDTTGNYVASITNGSYITGGNGGSEGAALTLAVDATSANTASKVVARDASGNFSAGTITAALSGNATTATTLATARTISLGGDLSGSASFNGSADITITATIAADSVALGTDTTGNYVATVAAGTPGVQSGTSGLSISATAGEGTAATIAHADTSTQATVSNAGRTYIQSITLDDFGHITAISSASETVTDTNTTYSISTEAGGDIYSEIIRLTAGGSGSGTDDVILAVGATGATYGLTIAEAGDTITFAHADTSTLSGAQGSAGIAAITVDEMGHVTAVTTATYLTSQANNFATVAIGADAGYTWGTANTNTNQTADSATDTITIVRGLTGSTAGIDLFTNTVAGTDAIKIAHADTSTLSGAQGSAGIASITVDEMGHVTAVTTATYLTSQSSDFGTITVTDTDSGYTWGATGSAVADATGDTLTLVSGTGINIDVDAASDAIRITNTFTESDTLATVTGRGGTTATAISITNATNATTTSSGALIVTGGVGIGGDLFVGGGDISAGNVATTLLGGNTTTNISFANALTSGTLTVGGTSQTGTMTIDPSTSAHTLNIATGANTTGTKTVNIATGSTTSGVTDITIGSTNSTSSTIIQSGSGKVKFNIGAVSLFLPTADGTNGQVLKTDGAGNLSFASVDSLSGGISNVVEDTTPQLGGNLDVNGFSIVSVSNANINISPNGTGKVVVNKELDATLLRSTQSSGDEGGQINLALAATNTTLSGEVAIDINQNRLRIFETSGTNRGVYVDLTTAATGVGTNLLATAVNTTYTISAETATNTVLRLTGSDASTDNVAFVGSGIVSVTRTDANTITITGTEADTLATVTGRGATTATAIAITNTTASTTVDTGALTVDGGVGLNGNLFVGGTGNIAGNLTVSGGAITAGNVATTLLGGNTTTAVDFATAQTSGALTIGGTAQTGTITLDRSTVAHTLNLGTGVNTTGVTKTINIGTGGASGSTTAINIGSSTSGATNTVNIYGDLTVTGTTTYVNTTTLNVGDNIITLNADEAGVPSQNAGVEIERGTSTNVQLIWNETTDRWTFTNDGSTFYNIPISSEYGVVNDGTLTLAVSGVGLSGSASFTANQAGSSTFTVTSNATSANTANTIVSRDASGNFTAGVITATSINKVAITAPATGSTLTIADGKTLTVSNTLTFTGTDASSVAFGAGGTVAYTGGTLAQFAATTSAQLLGVISDETGSGSLVFATSPTFSTSVVGSATMAVFNTTSTNISAFGAATTLAIGNTATAAQTVNMFTASTGASTYNFATGATATATTKTLNLGTGGAAGSTTNVNIGSSVAGTTTISSPNITISGLADTATAATHYYVETAGGNILPKTLANVQAEIVTTAAVNAAALTTTGTVTSGTWSASFGAVSGANLTSLTAGNLTGTIPSGVLGNSSLFVGTTSIALNRGSANLGLTGITSIAMPGATSGTITVTPAATAGTTAITIPATTGTLITSGDTGTVTSTMIADGTIVNGDINASAAIAYSKLSLTGSIVNADISASAAIADTKLATISTAGKVSNSATTATNLNTASAIVARDASGNFTAGTITAALTGAASSNVLKAGDTMTGQLISTSGGSTATGGGQIYLNGATSNRIDFNTNGVAAPAFTTRSDGTKQVFYPAISASAVDYAVGINTSTLWYSIPTAAATEFFRWYGGTTIAATLTGAGTFTATGDVCAFSDVRLKDNIEVIADPLDKVLKLRGVTFTRTDLDDNKTHMGVIAQEVEEVIPEVVITGDDGIKTVAYGNMVGLLIEAVKELTTQNKALLERVEQLEKKLNG